MLIRKNAICEKLKSSFCNHVENILTHPNIEKFVIDLPFDEKKSTRKI